MNNDIHQLVHDVAEITGAAPPHLMAGDAPVLQDDALAAGDGEAPYLVGLIGGKEVGKSALVNALVGERITASTSYGPGTETVVAYVHENQIARIKPLLEREAAGRYHIVTHAISRLTRQVLLDLPDIDSQFSEHVELTRRMLRHMLFPIWVQSIEKYADQQPQTLLAAVAAGNDPANFLFCLNKADQLEGAGRGSGVSGLGSREKPSVPDPRLQTLDPLEEIRSDYAVRVASALGKNFTPKVYAISALRPDAFDLPALRERLSQQKSAAIVQHSIQLAGRQRERSVLSWIDGQRLPERVSRIVRLQREAEEATAARLAGPLLETVVPRLLEDPAHRAAMIDDVMTARVARWPIVNVLHTLLSPLTSLWRRNVGTAPTIESLVDVSLVVQGRPLSSVAAATFALLQQTHPLVSPLYRAQRLWEAQAADVAAMELRDALVASMRRQRTEAKSHIARRGLIAPLIRWTLTIGALLWFPIVQPVLEVMLKNDFTQSLRDGLILTVQLLGATYLLKSAAFLAIWFVFLWLILRWDTQRRVNKLLTTWRTLGGGGGDATLSPASAVLNWVDGMLDPIRLARDREERLVSRAEELRKELEKPAA
ncbi:MAG: GTPase domain-containing protein [Tepidisphaeraceae bacterium]